MVSYKSTESNYFKYLYVLNEKLGKIESIKMNGEKSPLKNEKNEKIENSNKLVK
jgi:hypothetical protein